MIRQAVNSSTPHIWKKGEHSTAKTGNYLYLLLIIFLLWQMFSCLCSLNQKPTSVQTTCSKGTWRRLCLPPKALCEEVWPVGLQPLERHPCSPRGVSHLLQQKGRKLFPKVPTSAHSSIPSCAAQQILMIALHLPTGEWEVTCFILGYWVGEKKKKVSSSAHSCEFLFLWWFGIN